MTAKGRRGHGEDSIYRDGDRWRGAVSLGRGPDGSRRRVKVSGRTKAEVVAKLKEVHRAFDAGVEQPTSRLTVGAYLDRWVVGLQGRVEAKTASDYADTVRLHLRPALGHRQLTDLTVADVNALWTAKLKKGYKPNSIRIMRAVLRSAFRQAEKEGLIVRNVAALSDPPKLEHQEGRSLSVDQARKLLAAAKDDRLEALYAIALTYGLRRGEALGISWNDVDLEAGVVQIQHQVSRVRLAEKEREPTGRRSRLVVKDLKTKRSRRNLHLTAELIAMLRTHRSRQAAERLAAGPAWKDSGMVFTTATGTVVDPDNFSHGFNKLCERAGLGHWHPHELRHSAASLMLAQGTDLHVVSEILGHSSVAMTKDVYGHLVAGQKPAAAQAMSDVLFGKTARDKE